MSTLRERLLVATIAVANAVALWLMVRFLLEKASLGAEMARQGVFRV